MAKSSSFQPSFQKGGNSVFNDVTIRGTLKIGAAKKLVLVNENGKDVALKCNSDGAIVSNFSGNLVGNVTGISTGADRVKTVTASSENATHYLTMVDSHNPPASPKNEIINTDQSLTFNPSTNILTVTKVDSNFNGTVGTGRTIEGYQMGSIVAPGMALQTVQDISTTQVVVNVARSYTQVQTVTLETTRAGSSFLINGYTHAYFNSSAGSQGRANIGYDVTIDSIRTNLAGADSGGTDCWGNSGYPGTTMTRPFLWEPTTSYPAGTVMTFRMLAACYDVYTSGGTTYVLTLNYTGYGHKSVIQVTEIAGMLALP